MVEAECGELHLALATTLEMLGKTAEALLHANSATACSKSDVFMTGARWLATKLQLQLSMQQAVANPPPLATVPCPFAQPLPVERVDASNLSQAQFMAYYASTQKPVVITGLKVTKEPWTLEHIAAHAGDVYFTSRRLVKGSSEWAQLEPGQRWTVSDYIQAIIDGSKEFNELSDYLFDWGLPLGCPSLAAQVIVPEYFAANLLVQTPPGTMWHDSWPSLFVAPRGLVSELHIDSLATNFWMVRVSSVPHAFSCH